MSNTPLLDQINYPSDLKKLTPEQLPQLAKELREELVDAVSVTGGHLGAGLGGGRAYYCYSLFIRHT